MGSILRWPPPPVAPHPASRPGLSKCTEEREAEKRACASWFAAWCAQRNISVRDLQAILGVSYGVAQAKRADGSITLLDIRRFPSRYRNGLALSFLAWCEASGSATAMHG